MNEERTYRQVDKYIRPFRTIPEEGQEYDFDNYLNHLSDNLRGPLRIFNTSMLDLGNLICVTPEQRKVFRDWVFSKKAEMEGLMEEWIAFYGLDDAETKETLRRVHAGRDS